MTYDEVLYDLKEDLNINSDDRSLDIPDANLLFKYSTQRAFIIQKTYDRGTITIDEDLIQRILVPMLPVDKGICGIETDCLINRSVDLYLVSHSKTVLGVRNLAVYGVFEDPQLVSETSICTDVDCSQYPVKKAMHKNIVELVMQSLQMKLMIPLDEVNDASGQNRQPQPKRARQSK